MNIRNLKEERAVNIETKRECLKRLKTITHSINNLQEELENKLTKLEK